MTGSRRMRTRNAPSAERRKSDHEGMGTMTVSDAAGTDRGAGHGIERGVTGTATDQGRATGVGTMTEMKDEDTDREAGIINDEKIALSVLGNEITATSAPGRALETEGALEPPAADHHMCTLTEDATGQQEPDCVAQQFFFAPVNATFLVDPLVRPYSLLFRYL